MRALWAIALVPLAIWAAGDVEPIGSFESDADMPLVAGGARIKRVVEHATDGQWALEVVLPGAERDTWPGVLLYGGAKPDWSQRDCLLFDVYLAGEAPVSLGVRLDAGDKTAWDSLDLRPGWNRDAAVSIRGHAGEVDLKRVKSILIYKGKPRQDITLYVDRLRWGHL